MAPVWLKFYELKNFQLCETNSILYVLIKRYANLMEGDATNKKKPIMNK